MVSRCAKTGKASNRLPWRRWRPWASSMSCAKLDCTENGLDVDSVLIQGNPILTTAMVSGQVPLIFIGLARPLSPPPSAAPITVYLACGISTLYWRIFSTPEVKTIADLKGKKFGVTTIGSQEDSVNPFILKERGLTPDRDFAMVAVGGAPTRFGGSARRNRASTFIPPQRHRGEKSTPGVLDLSTLGLYNPGSCFRQHQKLYQDPPRHGHASDESLRRGLRTTKIIGVSFEDHRRLAQNRDPGLRSTYEVVTRFQDRVPYVNMKGIEFMLKTLELRDPRARISIPITLSTPASSKSWTRAASSTRCGRNRKIS